LEPVVEDAISESIEDKSVEVVAEDVTADNGDKNTTVVNQNATSDYSAVVQDEVCDDTFYDNEKAKSDHITVVHADATFRNSPKDDINSLQNYIYSEEHLKRNITKIEFEKLSRWEVSTKKFF
jgi:hypothetical protein